MIRKNMYWLIGIVVCAGLVTYLVILPTASSGIAGTVTAVDTAGMATIKTDDGQEHRMTGEGWKIGDKVECSTESDKLACKKS